MTRLNERIRQTVRHGEFKQHYRPWYRRFWGRAAIIGGAILIATVILFINQVVFNVRHLVNGDIFNKETNTWVTFSDFKSNQKAIAEAMTQDDPWLGAQEPAIYVIMFESFGCPYCRENQKDIKELLSQFGSGVRVIAKDFPTEGLHPNVMEAHLAAACANEQGKYWEYRDILYANQATSEHPEYFARSALKKYAVDMGLDTKKFNLCLDNDKYNQEIRQDYALGVQNGVEGTPTYLINGTKVAGEIKIDVWKKIVAYLAKDYLQ